MTEKQQSTFTGKLDEIKGKKYMRAHSAITWFRADWPVGTAGIVTTLISEQPIIWRAEIRIGGEIVATGHASETNVNKDMGKLETNAVRRALALCGYGTEAALIDDDYDPETGNSLPTNVQQAAKAAGATMTKRETPDGDLRNKEEASRFIQRWRSQSLSDSDVLAALGVEKLSGWTKGRKAADEAVNKWLEGHLADAQPA